MATEKAQTIEQILLVYLESKLDRAAEVLVNAKRHYDLIANEYTRGRLQWARARYDACQELYRLAPHWRSSIKQYRNRIRKRTGYIKPPPKTIPLSKRDLTPEMEKLEAVLKRIAFNFD